MPFREQLAAGMVAAGFATILILPGCNESPPGSPAAASDDAGSPSFSQGDPVGGATDEVDAVVDSFQDEVSWTGVIIRQACSQEFSEFLAEHSISPSIYEPFFGGLTPESAELLWHQFFASCIGYPAGWSSETRHVIHFYSPFSDVLVTAIYSPGSQRLVGLSAGALTGLAISSLQMPSQPQDDLLVTWRARSDAVRVWASQSESPDGSAAGWSGSPESAREALEAEAYRIASLATAGFDEPSTYRPPVLLRSLLIAGSWDAIAEQLDDEADSVAISSVRGMPAGLRSTFIPVYAERVTAGQIVAYAPALSPTFVLLAEFGENGLTAVQPAVIGRDSLQEPLDGGGGSP